MLPKELIIFCSLRVDEMQFYITPFLYGDWTGFTSFKNICLKVREVVSFFKELLKSTPKNFNFVGQKSYFVVISN